MENIIMTNDGGQIELRELEPGIEYAVYVPKDVNPNTPVFTYAYGSGQKKGWYSQYGSYGPYDALIENGSDSVVIMPSMRWGENWGEKTMDMVNSVRNEYGITNSNVYGSGFSHGGSGGFSVVAENLRQSGASNIDPQIVYMIDDYSPGTYEGYRSALNSDNVNLFKENDTIFFTFENKDSASTNEFVKSGLNVIRVKSANGAHMQIKENFFKNGVYNYGTGGELPVDGYTYQKGQLTVDPSTGRKIVSWEDIDVQNINTKEKLYNYLGVKGNRGGINTVKLGNNSFGVAGSSGGKVVVDLSSLQEWNNRMNAINEEMMSLLTNLLSTIESLNNSWQGNVPTGFIEDSSSLIETVQRCHNNMNNLSSGLIDVMNVESEL